MRGGRSAVVPGCALAPPTSKGKTYALVAPHTSLPTFKSSAAGSEDKIMDAIDVAAEALQPDKQA